LAPPLVRGEILAQRVKALQLIDQEELPPSDDEHDLELDDNAMTICE
jgi:hypothetical protein